MTKFQRNSVSPIETSQASVYRFDQKQKIIQNGEPKHQEVHH
jgi:hypothetical protein